MYPRHVRFSGSTGSKSSFYGTGYSYNESKIISATVTHSNELLGERAIGLVSDFDALDDPIDQPHSKFNLWWEGAFVAQDSQFFNCVLSMLIAQPLPLSRDEENRCGAPDAPIIEPSQC